LREAHDRFKAVLDKRCSGTAEHPRTDE